MPHFKSLRAPYHLISWKPHFKLRFLAIKITKNEFGLILDPQAAYEECAKLLDPVSCQPLFLLNDFFPTDDLGFGEDEQGAFF